jgi:hypothetical protein
MGRAGEEQHVAIDPYETEVWDDVGVVLLEKANLSHYVNVIQSPSHMAIPQFIDKGTAFDLAYIDGSHFFEYVLVDWFLVDKVLKTGGLVVFDDTRNQHVKKFVEFLSSNFSQSYSFIDDKPYLMGLEKSWRNRIKRLLGLRDRMVFRKMAETAREYGEPLGKF